MRNHILWLVLALVAVLSFGQWSMAQPPGRRGGPRGGLERALDDLKLSGDKLETARAAVRDYQDNVRRLTNLASAKLVLKLKDVVSPEEFTKLRKATVREVPGRGPGRGRGLATSDMVERILSFDKNKDGKVTKDELPERMHDLIARGDTNKDGALDRKEIEKLAADLARDEPRRGPGGRRGPPGPGLRGGPSLTPRDVERALDDLKLVEKKKDAARTAVKGCQENVRQLVDLARADLLLRVSEVLPEKDLDRFKEVLDRQPRLGPGRFGGPPPRRRGPPR
jgi:hypothetical protein